jgi:2-polyprenyl-3-methyl-5-hydroxy-6-metoxy-1,4-benzoquinol methylase
MPTTTPLPQTLVHDVTVPRTENRVQTETLDILASAENYNRWILETVAPFLGECVLEVGCGTGNFSQLLLNRARHLTAVDIVPQYTETLARRVHVPEGKTLEARCQNVFKSTEGLGGYDSIIMLNVLEHIKDDGQAVETLKSLLNPGGRLILLVPAMRFLYSKYDRSIRHYRRYNKSQFNHLLREKDLAVEHIRYFNFIGIVGWWINFCLLKKTRMEMGSVKLFDRLSPLFRALESPFVLPAGLSLIAIARVD